MSMTYDLVSEKLVVVTDLALDLIHREGEGSVDGDTSATLETTTDEILQGFSAEYTFSTE